MTINFHNGYGRDYETNVANFHDYLQGKKLTAAALVNAGLFDPISTRMKWNPSFLMISPARAMALSSCLVDDPSSLTFTYQRCFRGK